MAGASAGSPPPAKPWERGGTAAGSGSSPFAPPSTSTSGVVKFASANSDDVKDDENGRIVSNLDGLTVGRPMPARPWEQNRLGYGTGGTGIDGLGLQSTGYGSGMYGGGLGSSSYGSPYMRSGMYGGQSSLYGSGYGGGMYGSSYGGGYGMGGGMYGNRYGGGYGGMIGSGGYGMRGIGNGYQNGFGDPNFPPGEPPPPPSFWQKMLKSLTDVMHFFGRLSMLVDENTQAVHFFITALLQLCDRAGILYGELARFVLRCLGFRSRSKTRTKSKSPLGALEPAQVQFDLKRNTDSPRQPGWDNVWTKGDES